MKNTYRWTFVLLASVLVACGQQDAPTEETAEPRTEQPADPTRSAPGDTPAESAAPSASAESDEASAADIEAARNERNRLREQYQALRDSWDVEAIADQFDLTESQKTQLQNARETLVAERVAVRNRLRSIRDLQQQAESAGDQSTIEALRAEAAQIQGRLEVAEGDWKKTLAETLLPEQLENISVPD
ncbi:MAG: hypothetical protein V2J20_06995 [Wenzhouxiangella sp.]|jgi:hypothetical protein|nr:hypothetical protein [Wenzhouxiangella sp.]